MHVEDYCGKTAEITGRAWRLCKKTGRCDPFTSVGGGLLLHNRLFNNVFHGDPPPA